MNRLLPTLAVLALGVCLTGCSNNRLAASVISLHGPHGESVQFTAERAETDADRQRGLMGRKELKSDEGMLFIFPQEEPLIFWMKDTLIPLDIVFFDAKMQYINAEHMVPCVTKECPTYLASRPAQYALEIAAGSVRDRNIGPGWTLVMP